ncbi:MAG: family 1 glycosylhydrolase [Verrucomicrobiota bacterium JB023]|nr:family 1 glycosylhydrolase [Verrucomicrobiota bacterium JB023]
MTFPDSLLFGVANADHQVEAYDPDHPDVWDLWEKTQKLTPRKRAADFWHRYPEDLERAASLGCKIFRFSISWARVQEADGSWNIEALDHYRKIAEQIRSHGMKVMVTLVHFTWPVWLEREGGLIASTFPDRFAAYAKKVATHLGDLVDYWVSFNEPTQLVYGFIKPWWQNRYYMPPGLPAGSGASGEAEALGKLIPNLFLAHTRARVCIKELRPEAKVGVNPLVTGFPPWLQNFLDNQLRREWLLRAMYRFSMAEPLITERAKVDIVIGGLTSESHHRLSYSTPYAVTGKAIIVLADSSIQDLDDLAGKKAAYVGETGVGKIATTHLPDGCELVRFNHVEKARQALTSGEVSAIYGDELLILPDQLGDKDRFRLLVKGLTRETHAVGLPIGHSGLLHLVDNVIADFRCEYFGACEVESEEEATGDTVIPLSLADYFAGKVGKPKLKDGEGLRRIRRRGRLKVGIREDAPGMCESCPTPGLEVALAKAVAQAIFEDPDKVEFIKLAPTHSIKALETKAGVINKVWRYTGTIGLIANSNWWYLGSKGKLPENLCPAECHGAHDFVGLDYYWGLPTTRLHEFHRLIEAGEGRFLNAPVWPEGLGHALRHLHRWFPDQELLIIENGCVPIADGVTRQEYLRVHLDQVAQACADGLPISAYLCWSLTSNREWGHPFTDQTDFGLYHIAMDTDPDLKRVPSPEVDYYRKVIANRSI